MKQTQSEKWVIRRAHRVDAAALKSCMIAAFERPTAMLGGAPLPPMTADYECEIRDYLVWVVVQENKIIGGLVLEEKPSHMLIGIIGVDPKVQGLGIGKALLDLAENKSQQAGLNELRLATHIALTENISFYKHLGWRERGRDDVRIYMSKKLG